MKKQIDVVPEEVEQVGGVKIIKKGEITEFHTGTILGFTVNVICLDGVERQVIKRFRASVYSVKNILGQSTICKKLNRSRYGKELQSWVDAQAEKLKNK